MQRSAHFHLKRKREKKKFHSFIRKISKCDVSYNINKCADGPDGQQGVTSGLTSNIGALLENTNSTPTNTNRQREKW